MNSIFRLIKYKLKIISFSVIYGCWLLPEKNSDYQKKLLSPTEGLQPPPLRLVRLWRKQQESRARKPRDAVANFALDIT